MPSRPRRHPDVCSLLASILHFPDTTALLFNTNLSYFEDQTSMPSHFVNNISA